MQNVLLVAKKFLSHAGDSGQTLTPMQLLKLAYIAHGWMLGLYGRPLIAGDVEAWKYGPVIPELYHKVKNFRHHPVTDIVVPKSVKDKPDKDEDDIIKQVYNKYGHYSGPRLSMLTHAKDTPWYKTWHAGRDIIPNDLIEYYYSELATKAN